MNIYSLVLGIIVAVMAAIAYITRPKSTLTMPQPALTSLPVAPTQPAPQRLDPQFRQSPTASTTPPVAVPASSTPTTNQQRLYRAAAASLGKIMKADGTVPNLYACASSLSGVLMLAGFGGLPRTGIANTSVLCDYFLGHPQFFQKVQQPAPGDIVISPSPVSPQPNQLDHGHCGVMAAVNQGIMSNDSDTGDWREKWTLPAWLDYYGTYGRLNTFYFRYIG